MTRLLLEYKPEKFLHALPIKDKLMWYHKQGLLQTATGYGRKLNTGKMVLYAGRWRRLYCHCFSNCVTYYILIKGKRISFLD